MDVSVQTVLLATLNILVGFGVAWTRSVLYRLRKVEDGVIACQVETRAMKERLEAIWQWFTTQLERRASG